MNPIILRINDWATGRFTWQQDAIRRICVNGNVNERDIQELELMCLQANNVPLPERAEAPDPIALDVEGDTVPDGVIPPVKLSKEKGSVP